MGNETLTLLKHNVSQNLTLTMNILLIGAFLWTPYIETKCFQREPATFNKASMMNIGFKEAMKLGEFDCIVFHDIDLMMEDDRAIFYCDNNPVHYAGAMNTWNYTYSFL